MRSSTTLLAALTSAVAVVAVPDVFTISARYTNSAGALVTLPTWYGDGKMYVGSTVPDGVQTAFNYTANTTRFDLIYIHPTASLLPSDPSDLSLPDPTFLALNAGSSAAGSPVEFRHDAVGLGDDWILFFARYSNLILAQSPSGRLLSTFYLRPAATATATAADGDTSVVAWGEATASDEDSGQLVSLIAVA
ncbi:hypothetical protein F5X99DRAFT_401618 [Biscogniauxia marginata]|nr:hypothetical protein F5X99DRAFT_401618 [Biscogniauxia marginata]